MNEREFEGGVAVCRDVCLVVNLSIDVQDSDVGAFSYARSVVWG